MDDRVASVASASAESPLQDAGLLRSAGRIVPFDLIIGLFTSRHQCVHDMIANTIVVRRDPHMRT